MQFNAADQLTAMTGHTYQYDGTGNIEETVDTQSGVMTSTRGDIGECTCRTGLCALVTSLILTRSALFTVVILAVRARWVVSAFPTLPRARATTRPIASQDLP